VKNVERGEARIRQRNTVSTVVAKKVALSKDPINELVIPYGPNRGRAFTEEEDRFLVCAAINLCAFFLCCV